MVRMDNSQEGRSDPTTTSTSPKSHSQSSIVVIDNGSGTIKAGFAGESSPRHILSNCAAQPFGGSRHYTTSSSQQQQSSSVSTHQLMTGDDALSLSDYFCLRSHQFGLLCDANLEASVWDRLFSKSCLHISDPSSHSLIVTEQFNTPTSVRQLLTQIVFEEFGFSRMVISPSQQLVPFAFASLPPSTPVDLWTSNRAAQHHQVPCSMSPTKAVQQQQRAANKKQRLSAVERKKLKQDFSCFSPSPSSPWSSIQSFVMGDTFNPRRPLQAPESYCQLVVDVGHQSSWVVPMYGELPLEVGSLRIDLGGHHASSLLKNLLAYQQVNLERTELLVHHIKEESCFVSLNYLEDLRTLKSQSAVDRRLLNTHLTHQYLLPDFNIKDKAFFKNFFRAPRTASVPTYTACERDGTPAFFVSRDSMAHPLPDSLRATAGGSIPGNASSHMSAEMMMLEPSSSFSGTESGGDQRSVLTLNVERIAPSEIFFNPQDYDFQHRALSSSSTSDFFGVQAPPASSTAEGWRTIGSSSASMTQPLFQAPNPAKQTSLPEAIQRSIFSCPPVLQSALAAKILLCGGSSAFPNFANRLYCELRPLLPEDWPINIYQLVDPSETAWIGASVWASENSSANYDTFCVTKSQYMESGPRAASTRNGVAAAAKTFLE